MCKDNSIWDILYDRKWVKSDPEPGSVILELQEQEEAEEEEELDLLNRNRADSSVLGAKKALYKEKHFRGN